MSQLNLLLVNDNEKVENREKKLKSKNGYAQK